MTELTKNTDKTVTTLCDTIASDIEFIQSKLATVDSCCLPTWLVSKLATSSAYLSSLRDFVSYNMENILEESSEDESSEADKEEEQETEEIEEPETEEDMLPPSYRLVSYAP